MGDAPPVRSRILNNKIAASNTAGLADSYEYKDETFEW